MALPGSNARRLLIGIASAAAIAAAPCPARPDLPGDRPVPAPIDRPSGRPWRLSGLTVGFADDFLGMPRSRLSDDNGFVANLRIAAELSGGERALRIVASEQMITERGGLRRVDDGRVYATWLRRPATPAKGLTYGWLAGVDVVGNLGGSQMQNWAHHALFRGRWLEGTGWQQLQYQYPDRTEVLGMVGALARLVQPLAGPVSVRGGFESAVGAGTGVFVEFHPYVAVGVATEHADLELREGAATYGTTIRPLTMPGGYVTGILELQPSARLTLTGPGWFPATLTVQLDWNAGDTHQHVGEIALGARF